MTKMLTLCALCLAASTLAPAQTTSLPYNTGFENAMPPWQLIRKGYIHPFYEWTIGNSTPYAGASSLYHGYPVGATQASDDWFVSPAFSFTTGGKIDSLRHHFSGFGVPQAGDTVAIYLLQGNPDPALATKTLLHDFRGANYTADNQWNQTTNIAIPPTSGTSYIAFRYYTINNWLDVTFDNLGISGNPNGLQQVYKPGEDFTVMPNPAANQLTVNTNAAFAWAKIYDMTGKVVYNQRFKRNMDISNLPAGSYFLELSDDSQQKGYITVLKQ